MPADFIYALLPFLLLLALLFVLMLLEMLRVDARVVAPLLADPDAVVRRRAAYVAGNLGLERVAPALATLLAPSEPAELRENIAHRFHSSPQNRSCP